MKTTFEMTNGDTITGKIVKFDYDIETWECVFTVETRFGTHTLRETELESPRNPNYLIHVSAPSEEGYYCKVYNTPNVDSNVITEISNDLSPFFNVVSWRCLSATSVMFFLEPTSPMAAFLSD